MAQLNSTCVIGTLAISASHSNAQQAIMIGGASNNAEFTNQCNLIAIGENTALSSSGALNPATLTVTQEGSGFNVNYSYYARNQGCVKPVIITGGGGGTGADFAPNIQRYTSPYSGTTCGDVNSITICDLGSGYTSTATGTVCDPTKSTEVCEIFTIEPFHNENSINIGHNAGCRAAGANTIRIGSGAAKGNLANGYCYQQDSIAIGANTMLSGSYENSIAIGHNALKGCSTSTDYRRCMINTTVIGSNSLPNSVCRQQYTTVVGACNYTSGTCSYADVAIGYGNAQCVGNMGSYNVIGGFTNAIATGTNKNMGSYNILLGAWNMCCSACGQTNILIGNRAMGYGCVNNGNCNIGIGRSPLARITTGDYNIGIGDTAGCNVTTATRTISIGHAAGLRHVTGNESMYLGAYAGAGICCGDANVIVGGYAASCYLANNNACRNQIFGYAAASRIGVGSMFNTVIGHGTACNLRCSTTSNIYIGSFAGIGTAGTIDGNANNIVLGYYAGNNVCGDGNIFIGCGINNCSSHTSFSERFHLGYGSGNCLLVGCLNSGGRTLGICGTLSKTAGSFQIQHPDPAKTQACELWHSFVESPTAGDNLYRFKVEVENGQTTIDLPDYYKHLNEDDQVWVNAKDHFGRAYGVVNQEQTTLTVFADTDGEYNILLIGTRKDEDAVNAWKGTERLKEN